MKPVWRRVLAEITCTATSIGRLHPKDGDACFALDPRPLHVKSGPFLSLSFLTTSAVRSFIESAQIRWIPCRLLIIDRRYQQLNSLILRGQVAQALARAYKLRSDNVVMVGRTPAGKLPPTSRHVYTITR